MKKKFFEAIKFLKGKLKSESAIKSVSLLAGGTAIGQIINILVTPILSRLYSPADFGVLAIYSALLSILGCLSSFSYHLAIPLPEEDRKASNLLFLSCMLNVLLVCVIFFVIYFVGNPLFLSLGWQVIIPYKYLLPVGVFFTGLYTSISYFALRYKAYGAIAQTNIAQKICGVSASIFMGRQGFAPSGLLWGQIISMAGGIFTLIKHTRSHFFRHDINKESVTIVAKAYRNFPLFQTCGTMFNTLSVQIMPLLLVSFFSSNITGWFAMSMRVLHLPALFLGKSIGQVYYQKGSVAYREGRLSNVTLRTLNALTLLGTFPILSLGVIAPDLFPLVFGDLWKPAGYYTLCLSPYLWLEFLASPISNTFLILGKQRYLAFFQGIMLVTGVFSLYIGTLTKGIYFPIVIYSMGKFVIYFLYLVLIMKLVRGEIGDYLRGIIKELFFTILFIFPIILVQFYSDSRLLSVGIWGIICILYLLLLFFRKDIKKSNNIA